MWTCASLPGALLQKYSFLRGHSGISQGLQQDWGGPNLFWAERYVVYTRGIFLNCDQSIPRDGNLQGNRGMHTEQDDVRAKRHRRSQCCLTGQRALGLRVDSSLGCCYEFIFHPHGSPGHKKSFLNLYKAEYDRICILLKVILYASATTFVNIPGLAFFDDLS
jgi:hypothetical protein